MTSLHIWILVFLNHLLMERCVLQKIRFFYFKMYESNMQDYHIKHDSVLAETV